MSVGVPRVRLEEVTHRFGDVTALDGVSLDVHEGEFVTLLGPSGCGKTTLLRIVAGFERPTEGQVILSGDDVTRTPAHRRPVNMVFQRPTLFPHLDVFENVAFGLRIAGVAHDEIRSRVGRALALVRLEGYEGRRNYELSGGQMQRVALARALVNRPKVLLLDEPLSALDLKIRLEMEAELRRVHRETGATFVYVTHDQREALALSDRIVVFNDGRIEQVGEPDHVYRDPVSPFVARFVGDSNVIEVEVEPGGASVRMAGRSVPAAGNGADPGSAWLVLRPEVVRIEQAGTGPGLRGVVRDVSFRGTGHTYRVEVKGLDDPVKVEIRGGGSFELDDEVELGWDPRRVASSPARRTNTEQMAVGLALITALMWGVMEVLLLRMAKRAGAFTVALWLSVLGGALALPIAIVSGPPGDDGGQLALALLPGLLGLGATFLYLVALRVGQLTVVSPTVATSGGVGAVLAVVFLDERFQMVVVLAVTASVIGVVMASASRRGGVTGAGWAAPAALLFGAYTTTLAVSAERIGPMWAVLGYRVATLLVLVPAGVVMGGRRLSLPRDARAPIAAAAVLETAGFAAFSAALDLGPVAVVSVVMAQFTTVAVVLAAVVLKERMRPHQWAGVAIVIGSIVALGALR